MDCNLRFYKRFAEQQNCHFDIGSTHGAWRLGQVECLPSFVASLRPLDRFFACRLVRSPICVCHLYPYFHEISTVRLNGPFSKCDNKLLFRIELLVAAICPLSDDHVILE